jgi:hypothetical protein
MSPYQRLAWHEPDDQENSEPAPEVPREVRAPPRRALKLDRKADAEQQRKQGIEFVCDQEFEDGCERRIDAEPVQPGLIDRRHGSVSGEIRNV